MWKWQLTQNADFSPWYILVFTAVGITLVFAGDAIIKLWKKSKK